jgi:hypothetical protein
MQPKLLSFDPTHELNNNAIRFEGSFLDMNTAESSTNLIAMPGLAPHRDNVTFLFSNRGVCSMWAMSRNGSA